MIDRADLRLQILWILWKSQGYTNNQVLIKKGLASSRGVVATTEQIRTEMAWLDNIGAVVLQDVDGVFVATLSDHGEEHLQGARAIPDIRRPRPGEMA